MAEIVTASSFNYLYLTYIARRLLMTSTTLFKSYNGVDGFNTSLGDGLLISITDLATFLRMLLNRG